MLLLVRCEQHCVLLFGAEVEQELVSRLGYLSGLNLHKFVWVYGLHGLLLTQDRTVRIHLLYVNDFELDSLGFFVVMFVIRLRMLTA